MPQKASDHPEKAAIQEKKKQLLELTSAFCDAHLNKDYKKLCTDLIEKMARKRPPPFLRGRLEIWAAGIVHALGSVNFLFDRSSPLYISANDIAAYFQVAPGSASQKAGAVRDMFNLNHFSTEYLTEDMQEKMAPTFELLEQMAEMEQRAGGASALRMRNEAGDVIENGQFLASASRVQSRYYKIMERAERQGMTPALAQDLMQLMEQDPDYLDPYLTLREIFIELGNEEEATEVLEIAYARALARILLPSGDWPPALEWGWLENRPIIRTLLNKALEEWINGDPAVGLDILRKLLRSNPGDNIGARWYILAIRLGITLEDFEAEVGSEYGYDAMKTEAWFAKHHTRFPEDFDWWKKAVEYEE